MLLNSIKHHIQVFLNQILTTKIIGATLLLTFIVGCAALPSKSIRKQLLGNFLSKEFQAQHTGFLIIDLENKDTLFNLNSDKYFIPASTTKLFSFYTSLKLLDDSLPALKFVKKNGNLLATGTGDPTWLHPHFNNKVPISFLKQFDSISFFLDNYAGEKFGPGWAWEDYPYYFSPERSSLPLFGNVVTLEVTDSIKVTPKYFLGNVQRKKGVPSRKWKENQFFLTDMDEDTLHVPYITSNELTLKLLAEKTGKNIALLDSLPIENWEILPGISRDSVLKQMLLVSDNFLAEQLMLMASSTLSDTLSFEKSRDFILDNNLSDLKQKPRWVDGSGLSRYNLFTPESMVTVLQKLHSETDSLRLFSLMPHWDLNGTITQENSNSDSFIRAKSGSMGNVYNLSGYLETRSGKLLAFSFMNNHFKRPSSGVQKNMYDILTAIHYSY